MTDVKKENTPGKQEPKPESKKNSQDVEFPFSFSLEGIENKSFCIVKAGNTDFVNPISLAIAFYGWTCCIPKLETVSDFDELWFRLTYLRNIGLTYYENEGVLHSLEPIYSDIVNHKGTTIEIEYMERKKWMNHVVSMVINITRKKCELSKSKIPYEEFMDLREQTMQQFIQGLINNPK